MIYLTAQSYYQINKKQISSLHLWSRRCEKFTFSLNLQTNWKENVLSEMTIKCYYVLFLFIVLSQGYKNTQMYAQYWFISQLCHQISVQLNVQGLSIIINYPLSAERYLILCPF